MGFNRILGDTVLMSQQDTKPAEPSPPETSTAKKRVSFTGSSAEDNDDDKPRPKFRASGFVSKAQLQAVVNSSNEIKFDVEGEPENDKFTPKKRNTGYVHTDILKQLIENAELDPDEIEGNEKGVNFHEDVEFK